jgi:lipopolysaccharide heptosyltransferase II
MKRGAWDDAVNVLAVRLDALGDVLMTGPALRALRESLPGRRVTLLTSPAGAEAGRLLPDIDDVIVYEAPWMKATLPRPDSRADTDMIARLRAEHFDGAVIFTVYSQSPLPAAFLCWLADIPRCLAHCRENPYQLLSHWVPEREPEQLLRHEVQRQLDLVAEVGCFTRDARLSIHVPARAMRWARHALRTLGLPEHGRWALMHPGASASSRRYPPESFAAVASRLALEHDCPVLLTGGPADREVIAEVRDGLAGESHAVVGDMSVAQLAALLALAPVVITNNTGPAHLAAAVGTPVVDLYALTNPQHTPWGVPCRVLNRDVPCRNCYKSVCPEGHHECLRGVPPEEVVQAALELLAERAIDVGRAFQPDSCATVDHGVGPDRAQFPRQAGKPDLQQAPTEEIACIP